MDYPKLEGWVWSRLPPSKWIAGRRRVLELIPLAIDRWSDGMACGSAEFGEMTDGLRQHVRKIYADRRYGAFWIIVLSSLVGELVRLLVLWWLSSSDHKEAFRRWRRRRDG